MRTKQKNNIVNVHCEDNKYVVVELKDTNMNVPIGQVFNPEVKQDKELSEKKSKCIAQLENNKNGSIYEREKLKLFNMPKKKVYSDLKYW